MRARALAATLVVLLLAGCAGTSAPAAADKDADDEPSRTARGGDGGEDDDEDLPVVTLASASGGPTPPGTYPLSVQVPAGGATEVSWRLDVVPAAAFTFDGVQGPGCETYGWFTSVTTSGTDGRCDDVAEGAYEWSFTLNAPVASYQVQVFGRVHDAALPSSNATEP